MGLNNVGARVTTMKSVHVYAQMKEEFKNGKWEFGEKLLVNDLIEKFDVSRRPVMDAMKMLESDGFIEIIPQSGCKVVNYSKEKVIDLLLLTSSLESLCAELAALYHTSEQITSLQVYQDQIKQRPEELFDKHYFFRYNRQFHSHISYMTSSSFIRKHTMQLWDLNDFYLIKLFDHFHFNALESLSFHDEIINSIKLRDTVQAKFIMEEHFKNYIDKILDQLPPSLIFV